MARVRHLSSLLREACNSAGLTASFPVVGTLFGIVCGDDAGAVTNFDEAKRTDEAMYAAFFQAMLAEGVAMAPGAYEAIFVGLAHDDAVINSIAEAAHRAALRAVSATAESLVAESPTVRLRRCENCCRGDSWRLLAALAGLAFLVKSTFADDDELQAVIAPEPIPTRQIDLIAPVSRGAAVGRFQHRRGRVDDRLSSTSCSRTIARCASRRGPLVRSTC